MSLMMEVPDFSRLMMTVVAVGEAVMAVAGKTYSISLSSLRVLVLRFNE